MAIMHSVQDVPVTRLLNNTDRKILNHIATGPYATEESISAMLNGFQGIHTPNLGELLSYFERVGLVTRGKVIPPVFGSSSEYEIDSFTLTPRGRFETKKLNLLEQVKDAQDTQAQQGILRSHLRHND